jgi:hypothetical protein
MNRHQHPTNNDILGAPPGMPIEECGALAITRVVWKETGQHGVVSYWMPSAGELDLLNHGKAVRLTVIGNTHPPLALGVDGDGEVA